MRKRGRPRKFNQPSRLVAITLPEDVIDTLRSRDRDLARAIVAVVSETDKNGRWHRDPRHDQDAELIKIAPRQFLITVNRRVVKHLPGCDLVPFGSDFAFLALRPGSGLSDLALAVVDRLEEPGLGSREREALLNLRAALRDYVGDKRLRSETRTIIVLRQVAKNRS
jgi:hypothetical protein